MGVYSNYIIEAQNKNEDISEEDKKYIALYNEFAKRMNKEGYPSSKKNLD